jgi:quercetin dioxygenase-like cupin family protein
LKLPQDIQFKPASVPGAPQTAILYGDPTKPGVFVTRVKFSPGWKDPPHWHPDEVRTVAVLSGTFYFGSGEKWDESKMKAYPAGTFYSEPPKAPHYTWAKDGEVIIQVTGVGPSGKTAIPQQ